MACDRGLHSGRPTGQAAAPIPVPTTRTHPLMMALRNTLIAATLLLLALPAIANAAPEVGDTAPALGGFNWILNAPAFDTLDDLRGDVVVVWKFSEGVAAYDTAGRLQELYAKSAGDGLHILGVSASNGTNLAERITSQLDMRTVRFPVSLGGATGYVTIGPGGMETIESNAWVIDVDGKVTFVGKPEDAGFAPAVAAALRKVTYAGLGKTEVSKVLERAAKSMADGKYDKARGLLKKLQDDGALADDEASADDAKTMLERMERIAAAHKRNAEKAEQQKRYPTALDEYAWLDSHFGREAEGEAAGKRLNELKRDAQVKREMAAEREWWDLCRKFSNGGGSPQLLQDLIRKYPGTRIADELKKATAGSGR